MALRKGEVGMKRDRGMGPRRGRAGSLLAAGPPGLSHAPLAHDSHSTIPTTSAANTQNPTKYQKQPPGLSGNSCLTVERP